jgi:hypothetical protein
MASSDGFFGIVPVLPGAGVRQKKELPEPEETRARQTVPVPGIRLDPGMDSPVNDTGFPFSTCGVPALFQTMSHFLTFTGFLINTPFSCKLLVIHDGPYKTAGKLYRF